MDWIKQNVWQMGIGALLVLIGSWMAYTSALNGVDQAMMRTGLYLVYAGLFIPLLIKLFFEKDEDE